MDQRPPNRPPSGPPPPIDPDDQIDRRIVQQIRAAGIGERAAWSELLTRYQDRLYAICYRMVAHPETAADLTQDAFVKILQGLDTWDGRSKLSTWMFRVTMNLCLTHLRAAKLRAHASLDAAIAPSLVRGMDGDNVRNKIGSSAADRRELSPDEGVQLRQRRELISAALSDLEPDQRAIIVLRDIQGLDYDQIAHTLEIAVGTVKSRLFRARLALRDAINRNARFDSE